MGAHVASKAPSFILVWDCFFFPASGLVARPSAVDVISIWCLSSQFCALGVRGCPVTSGLYLFICAFHCMGRIEQTPFRLSRHFPLNGTVRACDLVAAWSWGGVKCQISWFSWCWREGLA